MRVEGCDHAVDRALDELGVLGLLDVIRPYPLEHLTEQIELGISVRAGGRFGQGEGNTASRRRDEKRQGRTCRRTEENNEILPHGLRTFFATGRSPPPPFPPPVSQHLSGIFEAALPG